jgi:hypothetical protein
VARLETQAQPDRKKKKDKKKRKKKAGREQQTDSPLNQQGSGHGFNNLSLDDLAWAAREALQPIAKPNKQRKQRGGSSKRQR